MAALIVDWVGGLAAPPYKALILIPQDYDHLTLVAGSAPNGTWELDTIALWQDLKALEASEDGIVFTDLQTHNAEYSIAGTTYADAIQFLCEIAFYNAVANEDWTVILKGSNNDLFDVVNGVYVPTKGTGHVALVTGNSAGLVVVEAVSDSLEAKVDLLLSEQQLTNEQKRAEHTTQASVAPMTPVPGKVILRDTVSSRRWEADAWEDENETIGYRGKGLEKVGQLTEVAWS